MADAQKHESLHTVTQGVSVPGGSWRFMEVHGPGEFSMKTDLSGSDLMSFLGDFRRLLVGG